MGVLQQKVYKIHLLIGWDDLGFCPGHLKSSANPGDDLHFKDGQKIVTTKPSKIIPGDDADESPKKLQSFWNLSFTFPRKGEREMRHANIL